MSRLRRRLMDAPRRVPDIVVSIVFGRRRASSAAATPTRPEAPSWHGGTAPDLEPSVVSAAARAGLIVGETVRLPPRPVLPTDTRGHLNP